ncbi:class I SAM-dependent methyltransferase [Heliomarina baculiformis]|uniref:SAM-dependent methyltransferase n=1 Tax=Heliomarina baculiformis TaxID=2872036 RepID=UPI001EE33CD3|nr:class I SAM-dependent methyltransferase [Heliomarina baculiformis]
MTSVSLNRLNEIYATSDDPWAFATSAYEQEKFQATRDALRQSSYAAALEIGCGNGELARYIAPLCTAYLGMDAVEKALQAAREKNPDAHFIKGYYPCALPHGPFDLIILSEFLYFLDAPDIVDLAAQIADNWPRAEIICVTYLGDTAHRLSGQQALDIFIEASRGAFRFTNRCQTTDYRIDVGMSEIAP